MPTLIYENTDITFENYATIGRSSRCTLSIHDVKLSRVHCEIVKVGEDFVVIDLCSQNGTSLNDTLVAQAVIKDGDTLTLGRLKIIFYDSQKKTQKASANLPDYMPLPIKKVGLKDL